MVIIKWFKACFCGGRYFHKRKERKYETTDGYVYERDEFTCDKCRKIYFAEWYKKRKYVPYG